MEIELRPLHPLFAAEALGVDLRQPPAPALAARIDAGMDQYAVLVLRGQQIDDDRQLAFARALGTPEHTPALVDLKKRRLRHSEMVDISNLEVDGSILAADDRRRMFNLGNRLWHTDSSFKRTPATYSMLHARSIPPEGGETEFADMRAAWDALPEATKAKVENLVCDHSLIYSRALLGFEAWTEEERESFAPVPQRLVRRHPGSGRKGLFLASHNRCTMHRGRPYDDQRYARDMRRMTLQDVAPTLEQPA